MFLFSVCFVCVSLCFVWFVLIHSIITRIKSKATKVELYVECFCFNIIIHLFFCRFCIRRSAASQLEIELGFHRSIGVLFCVLAIKTVTLFNYNFLGKNIIDISSLLHTHLLFVVLIIKSNNK